MAIFQPILDNLGLGFFWQAHPHLSVGWHDLFFKKKVTYPDFFFERGKAPQILHPQLIFGRNRFSEYCAVYHDNPLERKPYIPCLMGLAPSGRVVFHDFAKDVIHLLISGQTGSGKTSGLYGILFSLMWLNLPKWLRIDLFATKGVQMFQNLANVYNEIDIMKAAATGLTQRIRERMEILKKNPNLYTIDLYNQKNRKKPLRYEIIVFDEFSNILRALEAEDRETFVSSVSQIASQGRSLGMHLIVVPQRPDAQGIPSSIKSQMASSLTFRLRSAIDAQTANCPEATELPQAQAILSSNVGRGPLKMAPMEKNSVPFFAERLKKTLSVNGYQNGFK
jgi:DNA segregation ATPase FtsK/SpoIIIE-like protein